MADILDRYYSLLPSLYRAQTNPIFNALIQAWASSDQNIIDQLSNTKAQLFVATASGSYLDKLGSSYGVPRPPVLGLGDADFQKLIPNLSLKQKTLVKSFYDTMDVFWGPYNSRTNMTSSASSPFNVSVGDSFKITVDGLETYTITIKHQDIAISGAATALELQTFLNQIPTIQVDIMTVPGTGDQALNLRTNTPGPRGTLLIDPILCFPAVGFISGRTLKITDITQRTTLYQITPGEITIEIPATVPTLRRTLKGSHHFHASAIIESPEPTTETVWQGSFLYSTVTDPFLLTSQKTVLEENLVAGTSYNEITVQDTTQLPSMGGSLIFNFGFINQEEPVPYIASTNANTLLLDPSYVFTNSHTTGESINFLKPGQKTPYLPRNDGSDFAVYLPSTSEARSIIEGLLEEIVAAGVIVNFVVLLPSYLYETTYNPYT